ERSRPPTVMLCPAPSMTYFVTAEPLSAALRHEMVAEASPDVAVTLCGLPGTAFTGCGGLVCGGGGGGSPPSTPFWYLSTSRTTCLSSTTRAAEPSGALMNR